MAAHKRSLKWFMRFGRIAQIGAKKKRVCVFNALCAKAHRACKKLPGKIAAISI
jgi:hypothetical protein